MQNKEKTVEKIINILSDQQFGLKDQIEILGNVFIRKGIDHSSISEKSKLNKLNLAEEIVKDIERNGETLPNAIMRQGLIILSWLNK